MVTTDLAFAAQALRLSRIFAGGGRLVVTAPGRQDHARHVAVEFIHPAITGARSLPAVAVNFEAVVASAEPQDATLVIDPLNGSNLHSPPTAGLNLRVGTAHSGYELTRWYHLLWELVQLGLEHPGLTGGAASEGGDSTNFLYPFLNAAEQDEPALLAAMAESAAAKHAESELLAQTTTAINHDVLTAIATEISAKNSSGGRVFTIGNGGSACDAARLVRKLTSAGIRATCLAEDPAILTALANDLGVQQIFARQIEASMKAADVLIAFSTSGASTNLLAAFDSAAAQDATVVSCSGYNGGPIADHPNVNYRLVVDSASVHRIQESQGALIDELCHMIGSLSTTDTSTSAAMESAQ